jgi:hypothetical protein
MHSQHLRRRAPLFFVALVIAFGTLIGVRPKGTPAQGLAHVLGSRGLRVDSAVLLTALPPGGWRPTHARALVVAHEAPSTPPRDPRDESPTDVYLVEIILAPNGALLDVGDTWNLSRTSSVNENILGASEQGAFAFAAEGGDLVHVMSLAGAQIPADFTALERAQTKLTALQDTGQTVGIHEQAITLPARTEALHLNWNEDGAITLTLRDGATFSIPATGVSPLRTETLELARPQGMFPWVADRLRAARWFGDERVQWLKAVAFTARDVLPDKADEPEQQVDVPARADASSDAAPALDSLSRLSTFPPPPLAPLLSPPSKGEGVWGSQEGDAFIRPSASSAFAATYVRTDKARPITRIAITLWDPARIALHMVAGTMEPRSATGQVGTGVIPSADLPLLVAGFNGGFQAVHGEFGMQVDRTLLLPPKPYGATVMELENGETALGTWPPSALGVPKDIKSFRQNMTALIDIGSGSSAVNPWGRTWWGGTPPGWEDNIHTTRSGLCITQEGFVGYFYGVDVSPDALGAGMKAARCTYGMHLDMNPGLCGFEYYRAGDLPALSRTLDRTWEVADTIERPGEPTVPFRARRMLRTMGHINFPQYIRRTARDFFFLTERARGPGRMTARIVEAQSVTELSGTWALSAESQTGPVHGDAGPNSSPVISFVGAEEGPVSLELGPKGFEVADAPLVPLARGSRTAPPPRARGHFTQACIEDGNLQLITLSNHAPTTCKHTLFMKNLEMITNQRDAQAGRRIAPVGGSLRFTTPLVGREIWLPLQQRKR